MTSLVVLAEAEAELNAAVEWYERERQGLGVALLREVERVVRAVAERPLAWPIVPGSSRVRRHPFRRFPFIAYFAIERDAVVVVGFGHTSRKPGYWRVRLAR
jgi:plasmid stabilization system protein ParE